MLVQYLITFVKKTKEEIVKHLDGLNIKGDLLIGNQLCATDFKYEISSANYHATIFNMTSKGVSLNRNFLLKKSTALFVTFLDDDNYYESYDVQSKVEGVLQSYKGSAIRFNVISDNDKRPIKIINHDGNVKFRNLSSYGVWGIFFDRHFLIQHSIFFRENIGPGTNINHGEDAAFIKDYLKFGDIFQNKMVAFHASQDESTWNNIQSRDLKLGLFSHGYIYYILYGNFARTRAFLFLLTHKWCFPEKISRKELYKYMVNGIKQSKRDEK